MTELSLVAQIRAVFMRRTPAYLPDPADPATFPDRIMRLVRRTQPRSEHRRARNKRGLRPRGQRSAVVVSAALLLVTAGLALAQKWMGAAGWIVAGAAGLTALLGGAGPFWQRQREQRTAGENVVRRSVHAVGKTVTEVSSEDLRVHTAVVNIPYLPRTAKEREVAEFLRVRRPVLIVGPSMVGKTRLAAAVVAQVLPDRPLLLPDTPTALIDLDKADITPREHVIWLDDLDRFVAGGGVSAGFLRRLCESNWLVATLRAHEWDRFQPTDRLRPPEWEVLRQFELVTLDRERDRPAEEDLRRAVRDDDIREQITRTGIGEYVGAAQLVRNRLAAGEHADPLGYALVAGAADWSLTGMTRPVPDEVLPRLAAARLTGRRRTELDDPVRYHAALGWATREINPTVSLLEPVDGTYRVYDYALDQLATTERTVPKATWELVVHEASDEELVSVGYQAITHHDLPDIAEQAWHKAADAGSASAMFNLGVLLDDRGESEAAQRWWRTAAEVGHIGAIYNMGVRLDERGQLAEAEHWLQMAADAGDLDAAYSLGVLLDDRGESAAAERWWRRAADAGHIGAVCGLGVVLDARGELAEAEYWLRKAAEAGQTFAAEKLGELLMERRELTEAEHWYRQAAEAGQNFAMHNLGVLLTEQGELAEAKHWLQKAGGGPTSRGEQPQPEGDSKTPRS